MPAAIHLQDVSARYREVLALDSVTGTFAPGSMTAVIGPNGAGKSTLLKTLMGEVPLASGTVNCGSPSRQCFAYLPQVAAIDRRFPLFVGDAVLLGRWRSLGALRGARSDDDAAVSAALRTVGLPGFETRRVGALSVGQFQRVLFARLLLQDARVVLLDEPFAAVDDDTAADLLGLVRRWHEEGRTVVAAVHNLAQVRQFFPQCLLLARRVIGWGRTDEVLSPEGIGLARAFAGRWADGGPVLSAHAS